MKRRVAAAALTLAAALAFAGCAPPSAGASAWQQSVQTVAGQAAAGDYEAALASLDTLESEVTARRDAGEVDAAEADAILTRIATVRADLASLVPAPSATPTPEPEITQTPPAEDAAVVDDGAVESSQEGTGDSSEKGSDGKGAGPNQNGNGKGPGKDGGGPGKKG